MKSVGPQIFQVQTLCFATVIIQWVRSWDTVGRNCSNTVLRRRYFKQHGPSMARGRSNVELIGRGARDRVNKWFSEDNNRPFPMLIHMRFVHSCPRWITWCGGYKKSVRSGWFQPCVINSSMNTLLIVELLFSWGSWVRRWRWRLRRFLDSERNLGLVAVMRRYPWATAASR